MDSCGVDRWRMRNTYRYRCSVVRMTLSGESLEEDVAEMTAIERIVGTGC
jgi:hypothetical protein